MTPLLTQESYLQTQHKLARLEARLAALRARPAHNLVHRAEVERSYEEMLRQYRREIKLYEAAHPVASGQ